MATPKTAADLRRIIAQHQADLQRLGSTWGQIVVDHLDDADRQTLAFLKSKLAKLQFDRNTAAGLKQLDGIRKQVETIRVKAYTAAEKDIRGRLADLMTNEVKWSRRLLQSFAGARKVKSAIAAASKDAKSAELAQKWLDEFASEQLRNAGIVDAAMQVYREAAPETVAKVVEHVKTLDPMVTQGALDRLRKSTILVNKTYPEWWTNTADADVSRVCDMVQQGVNSGWTVEEMTRKVVGTKAKGYTDGILSTNRSHARNMVRTICGGMANAAKDDFYAKNADVVKSVEWLSTLDGRTCAECAALDHQRFANDGSPHPIPPAHPSCYDDKTRVLTDAGLKYFRDLDGTERFFSLNPESNEIELVSAKRYICAKATEPLISFRNHRFSVTVTKNHKFFGHSVGLKQSNAPRFVDAEKLPKSKFVIPCGGKWRGNQMPLTARRVAWLRFMAFWLADGSVTKRSENHYQIKIAQCNNQWMRDALADFPYALGNQDSCLMFSNTALGKYLSRFGHALNKYIPQDIKDASPEAIRVFLDAFARTDGHIRKGKAWKGGNFGESIVLCTASPRMRDDLCEMILKAGGRPSLYVKHTAGKMHHFRNGDYRINSDNYVISWNKQINTNSDSLRREEVNYEGNVYCVELEQNNTLYVERDGKFCFCGNCRCVLLPVTELTDLVDGNRPQANADFMQMAREKYNAEYPKKDFDDLAYSTRKKYYWQAMKDYEAETGNKAYSVVSGKTTFREYFEQMSEKQKLDWLGAERYKLYKDGKANINDFIPPYPDERMTVAELKARDKASFDE